MNSAYDYQPLFEQLGQVREQVDEAMVEAAFAAFYDYLTSSEHFKSYFSSQAQIERLIQAQKASFIKALGLSPADFRQHYVELGKFHAKIGIALEDMIAGLTIIRDQLLHFQVLDVRLTYQFIEHIEQHLAEGYFLYQIHEYLNNVRQAEESIRHLLHDEQMISRVARPLRWFIEVVSQWMVGKTLGSERIGDAKSCPLTPLINELELAPQQRAQLHRLHQEQHTLAQSLNYFFHKRVFLLVTFMLPRLYAVTMSIFNNLVAVVSQQQVNRLKKDALTGLLLRHDLDGLLGQVRNQCMEKGTFGLLMLDLDHFKQINDQYGHQAGDDVLRATARRLKRLLRPDDLAIRMGGEEFLVLLPCVTRTALAQVAERIRQAMADTPIELDDGQLLEVTVSIGGVSIDGAGMDAPAQQWIEQADNNLYAAKRGGRNRVVITPFQWADTTDGH